MSIGVSSVIYFSGGGAGGLVVYLSAFLFAHSPSF